MSLSQGKGGQPLREEIGADAQSESMRNRKPYHKPAFRFERVFETQALSCGKIFSHGTSCKLNPKTS
jgi:hypothetical protein